MKIITRNNPFSVNDDETPIYTSPQYVPSDPAWNIEFNIQEDLIAELSEHLYSLCMEKNGLVYYFANPENNINICRHELHYPRGADLYFYRLGLLLTYRKGINTTFSGYIGLHNRYQGLSDDGHSISQSDFELMRAYIEDFLHSAIQRIGAKRQCVFNHVFYISGCMPGYVKDLYLSENQDYLVAPARVLDGKIITALVCKSTGHSYFDSLRFAQESSSLYCAILTICTRATHAAFSLINHDKKPLLAQGDLKQVTPETSVRLYPEDSSQPTGISACDTEFFALSDWVLKAYEKLKNKDKIKFKQIVFCFFEAQSSVANCPSLALIGLVAGLSQLSKHLQENCSGDVACSSCGPRGKHQRVGDRAAICLLIYEFLGCVPGAPEFVAIEKWSKRVYSEFRSAFVHAGSFKFESHSQGFNEKNPGFDLPYSLPSRNEVVRDQFFHTEDYRVARDALQALFFNWLESTSNEKFHNLDAIPKLNIRMDLMPEAHICMPNRGWVCLTNNVRPEPAT
jgi:hypothetical protein